MISMADLLRQNTELLNELNSAVHQNERALIIAATYKLTLHNNVMVALLHNEVLPPIEEPEGFAWTQDGSAISTNPAVQDKPVD